MSEPKKTVKTKAIADVTHPGKSAPSDTSKSIITSRPIMKDPMVVEDPVKEPLPKKTDEVTVTPPGTAVAEAKADTDTAAVEPPQADGTPETGTKQEAEPGTETDSKPAKPEAPDTDAPADTPADAPDAADKKSKTKKPDPDAEAAVQAEQDAKLQKVIDSKKYFLPINAIEQRRNARFVVLGILLALVLVVAWVDIALDASLIHLGSVKAVTHFFSN